MSSPDAVDLEGAQRAVAALGPYTAKRRPLLETST